MTDALGRLTQVFEDPAGLNYETDYYRELANYQTALARMEALTGADLTSAQPVSTTSAPQGPERK